MVAIRYHWTPDRVRDLMAKSPRHWPRYELIDGELIVTPSPAWPHQMACGQILFVLMQYLLEEPVATVLHSPADLELRPESITQPDVFVTDQVPIGGRVKDISELPTWRDVQHLYLAIEVLSPSSIHTDRVLKRDFYLRSRVDEYWIVDLEAEVVERWTPAMNVPEIVNSILEWHPPGAAKPLRIDLKQLFAKVFQRVR